MVCSAACYQKACALIPGGVNSPLRAFKGLGVSPLIAESGTGALLHDIDGRTFIDYVCGFGPLILGHAHPRIVRATKAQMEKGSFFWVSTEMEQQLADKIVQSIPSIEKLRFTTSGTEATLVALRLARAFTGRAKVAKFAGHYHGHGDPFLVRAGSGVINLNSTATSKGIPPAVIADTLVLPFNDAEAVRSLPEDLAAIIVEPVAGNMGVVPPEPGFLELLREETVRRDALLIFDEVITGFRLGKSGAQGLYNIEPDLTCLGKIIGGGFPVAAVGGRAEILDQLSPLGQVYHAGTLAGNPVAMCAGLETLALLEEPGFYETLNAKAHLLTDAIRALGIPVSQVGSMFSLSMEPERFPSFFRHCFEQGVFIPPALQEAWFVSSAHTEEQLAYTAEVIRSSAG